MINVCDGGVGLGIGQDGVSLRRRLAYSFDVEMKRNKTRLLAAAKIEDRMMMSLSYYDW